MCILYRPVELNDTTAFPVPSRDIVCVCVHIYIYMYIRIHTYTCIMYKPVELNDNIALSVTPRIVVVSRHVYPKGFFLILYPHTLGIPHLARCEKKMSIVISTTVSHSA